MVICFSLCYYDLYYYYFLSDNNINPLAIPQWVLEERSLQSEVVPASKSWCALFKVLYPRTVMHYIVLLCYRSIANVET